MMLTLLCSILSVFSLIPLLMYVGSLGRVEKDIKEQAGETEKVICYSLFVYSAIGTCFAIGSMLPTTDAIEMASLMGFMLGAMAAMILLGWAMNKC